MIRLVVLLGIVGCGRVDFATQPRDGAADTKLGSAADARTLGPCTKLSISDDFNDGARAAIWTAVTSPPATAAETGGKLEVTLGTAAGLHYSGYDTVATNYDLRDRCMDVSYATTPTAEAGVEMQFTARVAVGTVGFVYHNGLLDAFSTLSAFNSFASVPYDAAMHKVLRLRDDGGTMSWETSPDGTSFNVLVSAPDPFDISAVAVTLEAGTYTSAPSPGIARYENFNTP